MGYTVAVREKGKTGPFAFANDRLEVQDTTNGCKPLTLAEAKWARDRLLAAAIVLGRPIECRIVPLR